MSQEHNMWHEQKDQISSTIIIYYQIRVIVFSLREKKNKNDISIKMEISQQIIMQSECKHSVSTDYECSIRNVRHLF